MPKQAPPLCRLCNESVPGPHRGHAVANDYDHDAEPQWRFNGDYHDPCGAGRAVGATDRNALRRAF